VADAGTRQLPGNARAADPWSARSCELAQQPEGCALSCCQQAGALCRVNRAQPTHAPAVSAAQRGCAANLLPGDTKFMQRVDFVWVD